MDPQVRTVEEKIAVLAATAQGVVTRVEMRDAGISSEEIKRRVRKGMLIPEYRVGYRAPSVWARYMAAVKACGKGALLCGLAAAYLLGVLKSKYPPPPEVLAATERRIPGLRTKRGRRLDRRDATTVEGIPTTTVPRTLVDLAAVLDEEDLARACHEAGVRYRTTPAQVEAVLMRRPNSPGAAKLRAVLSGEVKVVLSKLEKRFLERLADEDLPLPETNRVASSRRVDCRWPDRGLTVELNGYRFHNSRHAWDQDLEREREAHARDEEFRRYTYADVFEDPALMLAELRKLLA